MSISIKFISRCFFTLALISVVKSESYYVAIYGNDNNNNGLSITTPFRTVAHAATVMSAGDTCFIRSGTYHEIVNVTDNSGIDGMPLVFMPYNNERVVFDGTVSIDSTWSQYSGNIWKTTIDFDIWQLFADQDEQVMARWPNAKFSDGSVFDTENHWGHGTMKQTNPNIYSNGTFIHDSRVNENGELIDLSMQGFDLDEAGKEAIGILNVGSFRTWSRKITSHSGNTFAYDPVPQNEWKNKEHQYFLEGRLEFLDAAGEWFLDTTTPKNTLYYYVTPGENPNEMNIRGKVQSYAFVISKSKYVELRDLEFFGTTFYIYKSSGSKVDNCNFFYPSTSKRMLRIVNQVPDMSIIKSSSNCTVSNSAFRYTDGSAIEAWGGRNTIKNNYFYHIDYSSADLTSIMVTVLMTGKYNKFQNNTMHKLGASATVVGGDSALFEFNDIYDTGHVQSDGAMIQCMVGAQPGTVIRYNWLHDSKKYGARFDGNGAGNNGTMHHNVMWNLGNSGIMAKGYEHKIYNNTVLNGPTNKNDILVMIAQGGNAGTITRNNVANRIAGHRSGSYQNYPVPGTYETNENGYQTGRDVDTLLVNIDNRDFRPKPNSVLIDAGTVINGITDSYEGAAPDIGAYEYGGDLWSAGTDWNVSTKFGNAWVANANIAPKIDSVQTSNDNASLTVYFSESVYSSIENPGALEASDFALSVSGGTATLASATPTAIVQNGNSYTLSFSLTGTPDGSEVISVAPIANSIFDVLGNQASSAQSAGSSALKDEKLPQISSASIAADNSSIVVSFSENVFNTASGSGALEASDFALSVSGGTATLASATPTAIVQNGNSYTLSFSLTGTPDGSEVISVVPIANSVYDGSGNLASTTQAKGSGKLFDQTEPVVSAITFSDDNSYVDIEFSVGVFSNANGSGALELSDFELVFNQNNGTAISASLSSIRKTDGSSASSASALAGGESSVRIFLSYNGVPSGVESITLSPINGSSIYDLAGNGAQVTQSISSALFKDKTLPTLTFAPQNSTNEVSRSSSLSIALSEPIRKSDVSSSGDYKINNQNVDSLITLNYNNAEGVAIEFDAKISDDKKTISIDPVLDFAFGSTIYYAITGFEDFGGNAPSQPTFASFNVVDNIKPVANSQNLELNEDDSLSIVLTGSDSENFPLSYSFGSPKAGILYGNASNIIYRPFKNFFGEDSLRFVVSDGFDKSDSAIVRIKVLPINDPPHLTIPSYDTLKISQVNKSGYLFPKYPSSTDLSSQVAITDVDDSEIKTIAIAIEPYHSGEDTVYFDNSSNTPTIIKVNEKATFTFNVNDAVVSDVYSMSSIKYENLKGKELTEKIRTITINVGDGKVLSNKQQRILEVRIVNSPPQALSQNYSTSEDSSLAFVLNGIDNDSDVLSYSLLSGPYFGSLQGELPSLKYIPNDNFHGIDSLQFRVNDGIQFSDTASVRINVESVNDLPSHLAPTLPNDKTEIVVTINNVDNTELNFSWLKSNDLDGDQLSYLFSTWYEIVGENGNLEVVNIDTTVFSTHFSIGYNVLIDRLNDYRSPRGKLIWTVNVTDGIDTTYSNIRYSVFVEGKFIALSVVDTFIPKEFSLSQNYPNPFNPKTRIQFDIPISSHTTVVVYDLLGNKVATLIDENVMPGRHTLSWNAVDDFNRKLPSGIYFYQIQAEGFIDTKKMLLLK